MEGKYKFMGKRDYLQRELMGQCSYPHEAGYTNDMG